MCKLLIGDKDSLGSSVLLSCSRTSGYGYAGHFILHDWNGIPGV